MDTLIIIYKHTKRGVTLVELILYISLFTILVMGVLSSVVYLQSVLQYTALEHVNREQIYRQLDILQQYLVTATRVDIATTTIRIYGRYGYIEQYVDQGVLRMIYHYDDGLLQKNIVPYPYLRLKDFSFTKNPRNFVDETLFKKGSISVRVAWLDNKKSVKYFEETLLSLPNLPH